MPKILICDSYYPEVIRALPVDPSLGYEENLKKILGFSFGTFDAYSRGLRELGWHTSDVICNHEPLQEMWANEHGMVGKQTPWTTILFAQIEQFQPDVVFMQDLSVLNAELLNLIGTECVLAGQCSCPMPPIENVKQFDVIFSSFPHYVNRFTELGVKAVYNPLAFDPIVLERCPFCKGRGYFDMAVDYEPYVQGSKCSACDGRGHHANYPKERIHDVVFIGGVGAPSHWRYGMQVLNAVAEAIPTFKWWGYGADLLPDGALKQKYRGEAWGIDMYQILLQSRVCLNRHGEVAEDYTNNMRCFEASGAGSMLVTEFSKNLRDFFDYDEVVSYDSPQDAVFKIRHYLDTPDTLKLIARNGQLRTLRDHTYKQRMQVVSETLKGMLVHA